MENLDWSRFTRLIYINASIKDLYEKWATQEGLESWFLEKAEYYSSNGNKRGRNEFTETDDTYFWKWHNWEGKERSKVVQANGKDSIEFLFADCRVVVTLREARGMTCVHLEQHGMSTDEVNKYRIFHGCSNGWTFWLANLKAVVEHGISLNDQQSGLLELHDAFDVVNI